MGMILYLIAYLIELPLLLINFITVLFLKAKVGSFWKTVNGFFISGALARDRFANYNYRTGLNFWLLKKDEIYSNKIHKFGIPTETISKVLGHNQLNKSLSFSGWALVYFLWILDVKYWFKGGHCLNSI